MNTEDLQKRQNELWMREFQFSARHLFNKAQLIGRINWFATVVLLILVVIPYDSAVVLIGGFILDIGLGISWWLFGKHVGDAANFRKAFDRYVFGMDSTGINLEDLKENAFTIKGKHLKEYEHQINNTGNDEPRGVKDWYTLDVNSSDCPVLMCQKENYYWTMNLRKWNMLFYGTFIAVMVAGIIAFFVWLDVWKAILGCSAIIITVVERTVNHAKYYNALFKIRFAFDFFENDMDDRALLKIQECIEEARALPVVGVDYIYQKRASEMEERYRSRYR